MPPNLQIPLLRDLAMHEVANAVVLSAVLLDNFPDNTETLDQLQQVYFSVLPPHVRGDILQSILNSEALGTFVRFHSLRVLLDGSIKSLRIGSFPESHYSRVLDLIASKGTRLQSLDLRGVWIKGEDCCKLQDILKGLGSLKVLRIPHVATDDIMCTVSCFNKILKVLDVSGESLITRRGIESLCIRHHGVELLDIGRPGDEVSLEPSTVALLLKHLPNLLSLGSYSFVGPAVVCLSDDVTFERGRVLKLKYLHDTATDVHTLNVIAQMCPNIHSIYLDRPLKDVIIGLTRITNLVKLKLSRFECSEINSLLAKCGCRLNVLDLVIGRGILDVSALAEFCTQICSVTLYKVEHLVYFKQLTFPYLKKLNIYYATLSTSCLKYLICSAPRLEQLTLYCNFVVISDELVKHLFGDISCPYLQTIWISNAPTLTMVGVAIMLAKCPRLTELGYLDSWGLSVEDIDLLRLDIKNRNLDLYLAL